MPKTSLYRVIGSVFVVVHTEADPTLQEWSDYLDYYRKHAHLMNTLVVTDGGGPNTKQRADLNAEIEKGDRKPSVAICTDKRLARGVVTALSWFNNSVRAFSKDQVEDALRYLGVRDGAEMRAAMSVVRALQKELGVSTN